MTIVEMLGQSGVLTLLGMGIVFGFLVILVVVITLAGKIFRTLGLAQAAAGSVAQAGPAKPGSADSVTAAISAAVNEFRKTN
jgi:oxaloacetate decarboxylase gamma subunit